MRGIAVIRALVLAIALAAVAPSRALSQATILKVIGSDSVPVPFAWVAVQGGVASITDERGLLSLGTGRRQTLTVEVRRIGYKPWFGKLDLADTTAASTVVLPRIVQELPGVTVTGEQVKSRLEQAGFYDRWLMRQKGTLSATFIGPEEIEKRHVSRASDLLQGVLGVSLQHTDRGSIIAKGIGGSCYMTVLLDGQRLCPPAGCSVVANNAPSLSPVPNRTMGSSIDDITVNINQYVNQNDIAAIEVYARGGNMPISLQSVDNACGVIAIWTGSKR
jgi:hypothetical protein